MRFAATTDEDALRIDLQPHQECVTAAQIRDQPGDQWTFFHGDRVVCIAGVIELMPGRAWCWALLSRQAGECMVALTRAVRTFVEEYGYRRMEMYVYADFEPGCRWAEMLGFVNETPTPMARFFPDGHAAYLYARTT